MTASAPLDRIRTPEVVDDLVVEPAAVAWARRLRADLSADAPVATVADRDLRAVAADLRADHVALWGADGDAYVVLGASGFSAGARRMRLATDYPVVNVCRGTGGRLLRDDDNHLGPRAPGLPGSSSTAYAMVMLDDAGPVTLLTCSGRELDDATVDAVCALVRDQLAGEARV